jgi:hypothetical protein
MLVTVIQLKFRSGRGDQTSSRVCASPQTCDAEKFNATRNTSFKSDLSPKMAGRSAVVGLILSVSITFLVISHLSHSKGHQSVLQSSDECMPCSTGSEDMCHAGCLTNAGIRARLLSVKSLQSQLSALKHSKKANFQKAKAPTISLAFLPTETEDVSHLSIDTTKREIARENAELLSLGAEKSGGLGQILNSAQKNLLRAEAAEVRLRRQARLHKGKKQTIMDVFEHLRLYIIAPLF